MRIAIRVNGNRVVSGDLARTSAGRPGVSADGAVLDLSHVFGCCLTSREVAQISSPDGAEVSISAGFDRLLIARKTDDDRVVLLGGDEEFDADTDSFLAIMGPEIRSEIRRALA